VVPTNYSQLAPVQYVEPRSTRRYGDDLLFRSNSGIVESQNLRALDLNSSYAYPRNILRK